VGVVVQLTGDIFGENVDALVLVLGVIRSGIRVEVGNCGALQIIYDGGETLRNFSISTNAQMLFNTWSIP
jgi:hypothetical protein